MKKEAELAAEKAERERKHLYENKEDATSKSTTHSYDDKISLIDINTCSLDQLKTVNGIGVINAKKAIEFRNSTGGFHSVSEFFDLLHISEHYRTVLLPKLVCGDKKTPHSSGRKVDI